MPIVIGAVLAAVLKSVIARRQENREGRLKNAERIGTLFSAGLIVGESLIGVIMAFIIAFSVTNGGSDAPLALNLETGIRPPNGWAWRFLSSVCSCLHVAC